MGAAPVKAWRLNTRAELYALEGEPPAPVALGPLWCSGAIVPETTADIAPAQGLRSAVPVTIRARWSPLLRAGRYLSTAAGDLWHIDSVRDPDGRHTDMLCTTTALDGDLATITPTTGSAYPVRAALIRDSASIGTYAGGQELRTRIELALIEAPRLVPGERIAVAGHIWTVVESVDGSTDGVVYQVWVR
ncbi:hypothetical protein [Plasticicumulans acidivorans]|uniref:Uncharacterized protein n=1 Tax=Plasticicumulans acidivorans TaxID=886464 RepID=A0A317N0B0_9GAMM|nr:hypothetical protein [Plasticicumulans acidivorans]PWV66002.1 hypothetical protein C7443_101490 [Plasticicumulans acidivorans]